MRQLFDLARENVALKRELTRVGGEVQAVHRLLVGIPATPKEYTMPRILQIAPDGGGRYVAVDRDGEIWRGQLRSSKSDNEEYIVWTRLPSEFPEDAH